MFASSASDFSGKNMIKTYDANGVVHLSFTCGQRVTMSISVVNLQLDILYICIGDQYPTPISQPFTYDFI